MHNYDYGKKAGVMSSGFRVELAIKTSIPGWLTNDSVNVDLGVATMH